jgi:hypothetical protein
VIARGLAKTPADRYPDVTAFARALRDAIAAPAATPPAADEGDEGGLFSKVRRLFRPK